MHYRLANRDDAEKIADLRWIAHEEDGEATGETKADYDKRCGEFVRKGIDERAWATWIAEEGDKLVGTISLRVYERLPAPGRVHAFNAFVTNVYVRSDFRRRGVGAGLMEKVKLWARGEGIERLYLWSSESAQGYYESAGFEHNCDGFYELFLPEKR